MKENKFKITIDLMLFIIFLILKLDGIIQWKWVWVFAPIWITWAINACIVIIASIATRLAKRKLNRLFTRPRASGPSLVWDPKTKTMHGPFDNEK